MEKRHSTEEVNASILKHFALSLHQFSKIPVTTSRVFKTVSPYNKLEILPIHHQNYTNTLKKHDFFS